MDKLVYLEENENECILYNDGKAQFQLASMLLSRHSKIKFSEDCLFYPASKKEELGNSLPFKKNDYLILGGILSTSGEGKEDPIKSVLLQSKKNKNVFFVYDCLLYRINAFSSIGAVVKTEDSYTDASIYFDKDIDIDEPQNEEESEHEEEYIEENITPAYEPTKKKKIDNLGYSFDEEEIDEDESDEEEDEALPITIKKEFIPTSKSKPINLNVNPNYRKVSETKPINDLPIKNEIKADFITNSKSKPKKIVDKAMNQYKIYVYRKPKKLYNAKILVFSSKGDYSIYQQEFEKKLKSINRINWTKVTGYCPSKPEDGSFVYSLASKFDMAKFNLLCSCVDSYNNPISYLISYKEDPYICFVISAKMDASIVGFSSKGINIEDPYIDFPSLLELTSKKEIEEKEEKTIVNEPIKEEEPIFEFEPVIENKKIHRTPVRRVFILTRTLRKFEKLFSKNPASRYDFDSTIETLITYPRDELNSYFISKDNKKIDSTSPLNIYKFQFGSKKDYEASRLFYCYKKDDERKLSNDDIIIIGFTNQDEHEDQREEAILGSRYLLEGASLHQLFVKDEDNDSLDELPYLSKMQFSLLDKASSKLPIVFTGSAGTGKTLMSVAQYVDSKDKGGSILYLTYEPSLLNNVDKMFHSLGVKNPSSYTYLSLISSILDIDLSSSYAGLAKFRDYYFNYLKKHKDAKKVFSSYEEGDVLCLASYCFYNGVISGSSRLLDNKKKILTRDEFLESISKEEAFSNEIRNKMYDIGKSYYEYLVSRKLYSDGMLAKLLLNKENKPVYDCLIIDEYQDLSEICFASILSLLKKELPLRLYMFGDDNQTIQPTLFSISSAESIIKQLLEFKVKLNKEYLPSSYRSGPTLINYINSINKVKQHCIGKQNKEKDMEESSSREDENDLFVSYIDKKPLFDSFVKESLEHNSDIAYIFPSLKEKNDFIKHFSSLGIDLNILENITYIVEEAKGMEWDFVCLVRFLSSSKNSFDAMLEKSSGKHSSFHRMLFNRLYVGLTRAKNKIVMFEDNLSPLISSTLLNTPKLISTNEEMKGLFETSSSFSSWIEYAKRLFKARQYQQAYLSICRAKDNCPTESYLVAETYANYEKEFNSSIFTNANRYIDMFISRNDLFTLKEAYKRLGNKKKSSLLELCFKANVDASELVNSFAKNVELCSYMEKAFYFDRVASILNKKITNNVERILKNGKRGR